MPDSCAHCGVQGVALKRCARCLHASYCGAACQKASWKLHKTTCLPTSLPLEDVRERVQDAHEAGDWRGVLKWEGRLEELMEHILTEDDDYDAACSCNHAFLNANKSCLMAKAGSLSPDQSQGHVMVIIRLQERHVELLGTIERFRDQGEAMCECAATFLLFGRCEEASVYFQKARDVGAAHGFFLVESKACKGLGEAAMNEKRYEDGLDLLRNALVAASLSEERVSMHELEALNALIEALLARGEIDEVEPLVTRFRETAEAESEEGDISWQMTSCILSARLHEVNLYILIDWAWRNL
jgi:hypothetical protein